MTPRAAHHKAAPRHPGPGRPRGFDREAALERGLDLFWQQGFEATSLDDLTEAMGISRSSFYACFGSKRAVLLMALEHYSKDAQARLGALAGGTGEGVSFAMLRALAGGKDSPHGCMLVNCITELAPHDPDVAALGRRHIEALEEIFARKLHPEDPAAARGRAVALVSLALGTHTLGKSGVPPDRIDAALESARALIRPPG